MRRASAWWPLLFPLVLVALVVPTGVADDGGKVSYSSTGYVVLDPAAATRPNHERLLATLYDTLTALDPQRGGVVPAAAQRWQEAADGLSWTFHLDPRATWSNGDPVKAADFVAGWKRVVDPYETRPVVTLYRPLKGCAAIFDGDRAMRALDAAGKGLRALLEDHPQGIPGRDMGDLLLRTGVRPLLTAVDDGAVKRMLGWGDDPFPKAKAEAAIEALRQERRRIKRGVYDAFDLFGTEVGARAKDDHTLVVFLEGRTPWLPLLLARTAFAPLHRRTISGGENAFEPGRLISNGAYRLHGRGPKARPGLPDPDSVVHVKRRDDYRGKRPGKAPEVLCFTDQGAEEDLRRLRAGELQWMASANRGVAKAVEKERGYVVRPEGRLLLLRFRVDRPPFDDVRLRRALALAVDRTRLGKVLWPNALPATRLMPEGTPGAAPGIALEKGGVKEAKALLKEADLLGDDFPWVELDFEERPGFDDLSEALLKAWQAGLGIEMGLRIETPIEAEKTRAAGDFQVALGVVRGSVNDPAGWIARFAAVHPESGLGWQDAGFEALLAAAADVDGFLAGGEERLATLPDGGSRFAAKVKTAGATVAGKDALRLALLAAAEERLLDACVVVPLLIPQDAHVIRGISGLGGDGAWRNPVFAGSLRDAQRSR